MVSLNSENVMEIIKIMQMSAIFPEIKGKN